MDTPAQDAVRGTWVARLAAAERLSVREGPRVLGSAAKHTGFYTVRKYAKNIDDYIRAYGALLGQIRFFAENEPYETVITDPNLMMTQGVLYLATCATNGGSAVTAGAAQAQYGFLTVVTAALGVGDSTTAAAATDTDLGGTTNTWYQSCDAAPTTITSGPDGIQMVVNVGGSNANFAWNEVIAGNFANSGTVSGTASSPGWSTGGSSANKIGTHASGGTAGGAGTTPKWPGAGNYSLLSHKVGSGLLGTKASGTWTLTYQLTIS